MNMVRTKNHKQENKFPRMSRLLAERAGFRLLESQQDIVGLTRSMHQLELAIPTTATETHKIMHIVSERMMTECSSGTDAKLIEKSISAAVLTYSLVHDIYASTHKALNEVANAAKPANNHREKMHEHILAGIRAPVALSEASDMKTVFGTIFKELGEMRLEDLSRVAKSLPDFDIFLPQTILDQIAKKKFELSARRNSF